MKEVHFCAVELACVQQPPRTKLREILTKFCRPVAFKTLVAFFTETQLCQPK